MKKIMSWFLLLLLSFIGLLLFVVAKPVKAKDKTFPVGVPVQTQALFCFTKEDAQVIADNKGEESLEIEVLMVTRKCRTMRGVAIYVREVYRNGAWAVWELKASNIPVFFEATDYRGVVKGQVGT